MQASRPRLVVALAFCACAGDSAGGSTDGSSETTHAITTTITTTTTTTTTTGATGDSSSGSSDDGDTSTTSGGPVDPGDVLEVRFLGVGGFTFRYGDDLVMTAPLYSNPDALAVQFGDVAADPARIDAFLDPTFVADADAILSGHAHYDHLMDVPYVWGKTDHALVLGNTSAQILMQEAGMPDAAFVALDDPELAWVDTRNCPDADACSGLPAGNEGAWLELPQSHARVRALCSSHPAQIFGVIHFAEGCVLPDPEMMLPTAAGEWREGATVAYLIDFLDPESGAPIFRIYYQDAPTDTPVGHPPDELLDEKRVDLAVLNVGSWEIVMDHPTAIIAAITPRYVIGGHWENFFQPQDQPLMPIPFAAPPEDFDAAAIAALPDEGDAEVIVDGRAEASRYFRVAPGTDFEIARAAR